MTFLKQNWIKVGLGILILGVLFFARERENILPNPDSISGIVLPTATPENSKSSIDSMARGTWLNNLDSLQLDDWDKDGKCLDDTRKQISYLKNEKLSEQFTFDNYKVSTFLTGKPADLDIADNKYVRTFRTMIRKDLDKKGINFAGHYSIVSVGMTGMGDSYYIIDRTNGKAYIFPYWAYVIDFKKDSNLIIMDPEEVIFNQMRDFISYSDNCAYTLGRNSTLVEQIPFYFLWENNELKLLGPIDFNPPINEFWEYYFD